MSNYCNCIVLSYTASIMSCVVLDINLLLILLHMDCVSKPVISWSHKLVVTNDISETTTFSDNLESVRIKSFEDAFFAFPIRSEITILF